MFELEFVIPMADGTEEGRHMRFLEMGFSSEHGQPNTAVSVIRLTRMDPVAVSRHC